MNNNLKKYGILCCLLLSFTFANAQEILTGVTINKAIAREARKARPVPVRDDALHLPFIDDFSNYTGYPDPNLWQDRYAYVNRTMAILPPTIGCATLDALDENGRVYAIADAAGFYADKLTSLPIRMDYNFTNNHAMHVGDSIYFSFYYQPAGGTLSGLEWERIGNRPEGRDSLILEFGYATGNIIFQGYTYCDYFLGEEEAYIVGDTLENPFLPNDFYIFEAPAFPGDLISLPCDSIFGEEMYWEHIWSTPGCSLDEWLAENPLQYFKQVMIPITDTRWFINNFQFRFRNMASLEDNGIVGWASNVDQWNIDYVRLETGRYANDLYPSDVAFVEPTTSILKKYQAMPWRQYRDSDLGNAFTNSLSNLSQNVRNSEYTYNIVKVGAGQIASYTPNNENARPYYNNGLDTVPSRVHPAFNFNTLPTDNNDSATFIITHIFQEVGTGDVRRCNDTCIFEQKFSNYYAYDDGTAEAGYSILSTMTHPEASLAMRITLAQPDTLAALQMWFNSVLDDANEAEFTIVVWADDNGFPGEVLYEKPGLLPRHGEQFEDFVTYYLDTVEVSGTFYVGFRQNHSVQLNLGFDQNTDSHEHFVYKTAANWVEPFLKGTPMMRAVMGSPVDITPVREFAQNDYRIYPNPAQSVLNVECSGEQTVRAYRIYDAFGKLVQSQDAASASFSISVENFKPGLYILQLIDKQGNSSSQKFIRQ